MWIAILNAPYSSFMISKYYFCGSIYFKHLNKTIKTSTKYTCFIREAAIQNTSLVAILSPQQVLGHIIHAYRLGE
jgi:hypothetical protein